MYMTTRYHLRVFRQARRLRRTAVSQRRGGDSRAVWPPQHQREQRRADFFATIWNNSLALSLLKFGQFHREQGEQWSGCSHFARVLLIG